MKNILFILSLSFCFAQTYAQSFEINPRSISVPKYANQTAINAIPSPVEGALVYDIAQDRFAYYTGTVWTNFPSAGGGGSTSAINVPSYADATAINAIASPSQGMLVYNNATDRYFVRNATSWAEVNPAANLWTAPNAGSQGYAGSIAIGTSAGGTGRLNINNTNASFTNPDITLQTNATVNNVISTTASNRNSTIQFRQSFSLGTPAASFIRWINLQSNVLTNIFTVNGNGNARTEGFTRLGPSAAGAVAIKYRVYTGTTNPNSSSTNNSPISFPHGLDAAKIVEVSGLILNSSNEYVTPNSLGAIFRLEYDATNFTITVAHTSTNCMNRPFRVLITYHEPEIQSLGLSN